MLTFPTPQQIVIPDIETSEIQKILDDIVSKMTRGQTSFGVTEVMSRHKQKIKKTIEDSGWSFFESWIGATKDEAYPQWTISKKTN